MKTDSKSPIAAQQVQLGRYARIQRERRFLLDRLSDGLSSDAPHTAICDRYLLRTRFRLRHMVCSDSTTVTSKLTQKYAHSPSNFASVAITNTYLTEAEYRVFATLEADELRKRRYWYPSNGYQYAIDVFQGQLEGLILAEVEFGSDEDMAAFVPPTFVLAEVTADEAFTGGRLCHSTVQTVQDAIKRVLRR